MDPLMQVLTQRAASPPVAPPQQQPSPPQQPPTVLPSDPTKVPQEAKRFSNAQQIQDAYRSGWSPNPVLLRALLGHR